MGSNPIARSKHIRKKMCTNAAFYALTFLPRIARTNPWKLLYMVERYAAVLTPQIAASVTKLQGTTSLLQTPRSVLRQNRRQYREQ